MQGQVFHLQVHLQFFANYMQGYMQWTNGIALAFSLALRTQKDTSQQALTKVMEVENQEQCVDSWNDQN